MRTDLGTKVEREEDGGDAVSARLLEETRRGGGTSYEDSRLLETERTSGLGNGEAKEAPDVEDEASVPARGRARPGPDANADGGVAVVGEELVPPASSPPPVNPLLLASSPSGISVDALCRPSRTVSSDARGPGCGD